MRRVKRLGLFATGVSVALLASAGAAAADPGESTHVDNVAAAVGADQISVTGQASFVDTPVVVGEDGSGDAAVSAAPLGHELTAASIAKDPLSNRTTFTVDVANQPPALGGVPEAITYRWDFKVPKFYNRGWGERSFRLEATRTDVAVTKAGATPGDPVFTLYSCTDNGCYKDWDSVQSASAGLEILSGTMTDGTVQWNVALEHLLIRTFGDYPPMTDAWLSGGEIVTTSIAVVDAQEQQSDEIPSVANYPIPGVSVRVGIAPAGTAAEDVPLTAAGSIESDGAFTASLPTPSEPGAYTVVAKACYGGGTCDTATTDLTV